VARARRRPSRFTPRTSTANLEWSSVSDARTTTAAASTKTLLFANTATVALDLTILRIRFILSVESDQVAASEDQIGALGAIVITEDAFAAGATAVPGPVSDPSADFMCFFSFIQRLNVGTAVGLEPQFNTSYNVDVKSRRIVEPDEVLAWVVESGSESEGFITSMQGRILTRIRGTH